MTGCFYSCTALRSIASVTLTFIFLCLTCCGTSSSHCIVKLLPIVTKCCLGNTLAKICLATSRTLCRCCTSSRSDIGVCTCRCTKYYLVVVVNLHCVRYAFSCSISKRTVPHRLRNVAVIRKSVVLRNCEEHCVKVCYTAFGVHTIEEIKESRLIKLYLPIGINLIMCTTVRRTASDVDSIEGAVSIGVIYRLLNYLHSSYRVSCTFNIFNTISVMSHKRARISIGFPNAHVFCK